MLFGAASGDVMSSSFGLSVNTVIWIFRIALFVVPVAAGFVAYKLCLELRERDGGSRAGQLGRLSPASSPIDPRLTSAGGIGGADLGVERVVTLLDEHGRHPLAPLLLDGVEDAELVVDEDVVVGRVPALDVAEHALLVDVDQDAAAERVPQARAADLAGLEDRVAVGQHDGRPRAGGVGDGLHRTGVEAIGEGVLEEEFRELEELRIAQVLEPVALQRAQVVGVAELGPELFEDRPVALRRGRAGQLVEVVVELRLDDVVVEERVVDVEQHHGHGGGAY